MTKTLHYQAWIHLAKTWKKYIMPPSRPCKTQLKIWDKILEEKAKKSKKPQVLILGATPELRDICLKNHYKSTVCDINPVMIKAMTNLMRQKNRSNEKVIICDWLKMNFPKNSFDIIMGDASFGQILNAKDIEGALKKIQHFLKPDGLFLVREVTRPSLKPIVKGDESWIFWFKKYKKEKMTNCDLYSFYKYLSDANPFLKSPSLIEVSPVIKKIDELVEQGKMPKEANYWLKWLDKALLKKPKPLLIFVKRDLKRLLKKYFKPLPIKQCHDNKFCKYMPLFLAKPKK